MKALERFKAKVMVVKPITSNTDPILEISYTPEPSVFTIRTIISTIASANAPPYNVSVYHPPTLEERARRMQLRERQSLLYRLAFACVAAIPTFIIGIVYMTLVSRRNPTRIYLTTPVWAGHVPRGEWALFIMATPVMFYSAGTFHRRSLKEIRALWRKGSKTPVWKRFVRFGSMNLLVSVCRAVDRCTCWLTFVHSAGFGWCIRGIFRFDRASFAHSHTKADGRSPREPHALFRHCRLSYHVPTRW